MIGKEISGAIGKAFPSMEWPTKSISEDTSAIVSCLQEIELAVSDGFDQLAAQSEKEGEIDAIFKGWEIANDIYEKVPQNKKAMAEENTSKKRLMMEMVSLASPPTRICLQRGCST